jgi:hypothetical protein
LLSYTLFEKMRRENAEYENALNKLRELNYVLSEFLEKGEQVAESAPDEELTVAEPDVEPFKDVPPDNQEDIRFYKRARGYYLPTGRFCVMKGSRISKEVSPTFQDYEGLQHARRVRDRMLEQGKLVDDKDWAGYLLTEDFVFNSPSLAACIVDGNSRSGPQAWGRQRF